MDMDQHNGNETNEILHALLEESRKRTLYGRITASCAVGILLAVIICLLILVPRVYGVIENADQTMKAAQNALSGAENAAAGIAEMSSKITATGNEVNQFIAENASVVAEAVEQISSIDYESLNQAIRDLQDAVSPFAKFMNRFK